MKRRQFITIISGAAAAWPLAVGAQQSKNIPTVGVLWHAGSAEEEDVYLSVLVKAFNDLGYSEGKNIHLDHRFPAENPERFRVLARELVDERPDGIIAVTALGAVELKKVTDTIPIVFVIIAVQAGLGLLRKVLPDLSNTTVEELEGINVVRRMLGRTWIDPVRCERGIEALRGYRREHDERLKVRSMSLPSNLSP